MNANMITELELYLKANPDFYKLMIDETYKNNFYKRNLAYNFCNANGSLKTGPQYIFKNGNEILGPLNILSIKKEYINDIDSSGKFLTLDERIRVKITFVVSNNVSGLNLNKVRVINSIFNNEAIKKFSIFLHNYPYLQIIKLDNTITRLDSHMKDKDVIIINDIVKIEKILSKLWTPESYVMSYKDITNMKHIMNNFILPSYKTQMHDACIRWLNTIIKRTNTDEEYIHMSHIDTTRLNYDDDINDVFKMCNITINDIPLNYNPFEYNTEDNIKLANTIELAEVLHRILSLYYENK